MTSEKFKLNMLDVGKGLIVAAGTSVLYFIQQSVDAGSLSFNWKGIGMAAIGGAVTYLIKNFFTAPPR